MKLFFKNILFKETSTSFSGFRATLSQRAAARQVEKTAEKNKFEIPIKFQKIAFKSWYREDQSNEEYQVFVYQDDIMAFATAETYFID